MSNSGMSVSDAAALIVVSTPTLRRMFDADVPRSGQVVDQGRTGGKERRVDPAWAAVKRVEIAERRSARGSTAQIPRPAARSGGARIGQPVS